jgi:DNA-binding transcriptional MerR regulator
LQHIQFIHRAQGLGFSLSEIRELLVLKGEQVEACTHVRDTYCFSNTSTVFGSS